MRTSAGEIDAGISEQIRRLSEDLRSAGEPERWPDQSDAEPAPDDTL